MINPPKYPTVQVAFAGLYMIIAIVSETRKPTGHSLFVPDSFARNR